MAKRAGRARKKAGPKMNQAEFERKVAELKAELEKLPEDRLEQLERDLKREEEK